MVRNMKKSPLMIFLVLGLAAILFGEVEDKAINDRFEN